jgi:hypothetical protein
MGITPPLHTAWAKKPVTEIEAGAKGVTLIHHTPLPITDGQVTVTPKPVRMLRIVHSSTNNTIGLPGGILEITHEWGSGVPGFKEIHIYERGYRGITRGNEKVDHRSLGGNALLRVILGKKAIRVLPAKGFENNFNVERH